MGRETKIENGVKEYICCRCKSFFVAGEMVKCKNMSDGVGSYCLLCKRILSKIQARKRRIRKNRKGYKTESYNRPLPVNEGEMRHSGEFKEVRNTLIARYSNNRLKSITFIP